MGQDRYPKTAWLYDIRDLRSQGDPETVVFLPHHDSLIGLHIVGLETDVMLGIREDANGQPLSCAITNEIVIEHAPISLLSNPRKVLDEPDEA